MTMSGGGDVNFRFQRVCCSFRKQCILANSGGGTMLSYEEAGRPLENCLNVRERIFFCQKMVFVRATFCPL